jgi:hypothetical protein
MAIFKYHVELDASPLSSRVILYLGGLHQLDQLLLVQVILGVPEIGYLKRDQSREYQFCDHQHANVDDPLNVNSIVSFELHDHVADEKRETVGEEGHRCHVGGGPIHEGLAHHH